MPERRELCREELDAIVERAKTTPLNNDEHDILKAAIDTLALITQELEGKGISIARLRELLFGVSPRSDKDGGAGGRKPNQSGAASGAEQSPNGGDPSGKEKPKPKGHGRNGSQSYSGAERIAVPHPTLHHGDRCPECERGKLYSQSKPAKLVRIKGMAPFQGTVYEQERLRCNGCQEMFTAPAPEGVGDEKYDETVAAMLACLHYGAGLPFNRLEKLQSSMGIPLPVGTQYQEISKWEAEVLPAHQELVRQAAQGEVLHHDDTSMQVLSLDEVIRKEVDAGTSERTGVFTSGIVSICGEHRIALFYTGRKHAGENLLALLKAREAEQAAPIQMCDASSRNTPAGLATILANCNAHARRRFGDEQANFPDECRLPLDVFHQIFQNDQKAREQKMTADQRLAWHRAESALPMSRLKKWCHASKRQVEPNSGLGEAIRYMLNHWEGFTRFLRVAGVPLDNNICERALKKSIIHRKNSLFYKTENGARVGDMFMSFIHTAELNAADPFAYLVALMRHPKEVAKAPGQWMPWNYRDALLRLQQPPPDPVAAAP